MFIFKKWYDAVRHPFYSLFLSFSSCRYPPSLFYLFHTWARSKYSLLPSLTQTSSAFSSSSGITTNQNAISQKAKSMPPRDGTDPQCAGVGSCSITAAGAFQTVIKELDGDLARVVSLSLPPHPRTHPSRLHKNFHVTTTRSLRVPVYPLFISLAVFVPAQLALTPT